MKIIRRRRIVKTKTCAFRQWQSEGADGSFNCPNCGKTFDKDSQLNAAITKLLPELVDEPIVVHALPEAKDAESSCDEGCTEKSEGNNNHE